MKRITLSFLILNLCLLCNSLLARGGGGCLEKGTSISTPAGARSIENLNVGDIVFANSENGFVQAVVRSVVQVQPEYYYDISCGTRNIHVTSEHPIETETGVFKMASVLKDGDNIQISDGRKISNGKITSIIKKTSKFPAFNLLVSPGGTYIANGIVVHNKGCFLPDTLIRKADGDDVPISAISPGDKLLAFSSDGRIIEASVLKILTHDVNEYLEVKTDKILLYVTMEHPFFVGNGTFKTIKALKTGDLVYAFDGNGLSPQKIENIKKIEKSGRVYNLQTNAPNTFFANGVAVHNKGGGGGGHGGGFHGGGGHGGSGEAPPVVVLIIIGVVVIAIVVNAVLNKKRNENLDFVYSSAQVARKSDKTLKLLDFISRQDQLFSPDKLKEVATSTFIKLQHCWEARDYAPMKPLMMPDLYSEHILQIRGMVNNHEINVIGNLNIDRIDLVNVRYTLKENQREFTSLVTATAKDYYIDDRTREEIRGDSDPAQFQEFWTFQFVNKSWRLREIEQSRESDVLKEENFFEQFTDIGVDQIYGDNAEKKGTVGPWLERDAEIKDTKIERMLNFLVQTDKIWDRKNMIETARRTFVEMMITWESGEPANIPKADVFPEIAETMKEEMACHQKQDIKMEFRNLCVRKIELVLVRNFTDNNKDEYVARVRAHAQRIMKHEDRIISHDEDVTPFEQYLTFGRLCNMWKLKEVLLAANASNLVKQENLDQDSNVQQLQWYYQHKRPI